MCVCSVQGLQQETKNMEMHRKDTYTYVLNKTVQKSEQYTWVVWWMKLSFTITQSVILNTINNSYLSFFFSLQICIYRNIPPPKPLISLLFNGGM